MPLTLDANIELDVSLTVDGFFDMDELLEGEVGTIQYYSDYTSYSGATTVTPTEDTQVLGTSGTLVLTNITVNPIPTNYGKITYNGSTITVT